MKSTIVKTASALLMLTLAAACGTEATDPTNRKLDGGDKTPPTVVSSVPVSDATEVFVNASLSVTFSDLMDSSSLNTDTFVVTTGEPAVEVEGRVIYANSTAVFWPSAHFVSDTTFKATITTEAANTSGVSLAAPYSWSFTTGKTKAPGVPVNLGTAGGFAILAKSQISTVPTSVITGDIGISPAQADALTGFDPITLSGSFATASQVDGKLFAPGFAAPTPANLTAAISDMELAFTDAAGRAPDVTELGAGDISGLTLAPGVYKWSSGLLIASDVTLEGSATDVWIFQIAQNLTVENGMNITLAGEALPKNIFWQVSGNATIGTSADFSGIILGKTAITLGTLASVNGRLLAQTAVSLDSSTVTQP